MTRVKYIETSGAPAEEKIQALLDQMLQEGFDLFQIVPFIDDKRGNPSVTAGIYLFFRRAEVRSLAA
jgi:hypothetical protein